MANVLKEILAHFTSRPLWQKRLAFALVGAIGGYAYYYFIGCATGTCPISSNPYISTAYGAFMGVLVPVAKKKSGELSDSDSR